MKKITLIVAGLLIAAGSYAAPCKGDKNCCKGKKADCKKEAKACDKKACCKKNTETAKK